MLKTFGLLFFFLLNSQVQAQEMKFSNLVPRDHAARIAQNPFDTKSMGCTDGKTLAYFDLNGSDLGYVFPPDQWGIQMTGRLNAIHTFVQRVGEDDSTRKPILNVLYGGTSLIEGNTKLQRIVLYPAAYPAGSRNLFFITYFTMGTEGTATMTVRKEGDLYGEIPLEPGTFSCELFAEPYFKYTEKELLAYDCEDAFTLYVHRPFSKFGLVQHADDSRYEVNPGDCNSYFDRHHYASTHALGMGLYPLDAGFVGEERFFYQRVPYWVEGRAENLTFDRYFKSPDMAKVLGPNPPKSIAVTRYDAANWLSSALSTCRKSPQRLTSYTCKKR